MFSTTEYIGIGASVLIMGMSKGGLPISGVALPLLVLAWPDHGEAARAAVSFMLPLLCMMDLVGVVLYRGKPDWSHLRKLMFPTLCGVVLASLFFVSEKGVSVSDGAFKMVIGLLGLSFAVWHMGGSRILAGRQSALAGSSGYRAVLYGIAAGFTSTVAHAAGPVMQMYFLRTGLVKTQFAATTVYFFLFLNAVKLVPFAFLGRFSREQLMADLRLLPLIPAGVICGYLIVRWMKESHYTRFIYLTLLLTSLVLIIKGAGLG